MYFKIESLVENLIESLIASDGWKELHFISPTTGFFSSRNESDNIGVVQLAGWDKLPKSRDGEYFGAEVKMYLAKEPNVAGAAEMPQTRTPWDDKVPGQLPPGSVINEMDLLDAEASARKVLIVTRRGSDASYVQDGSHLDEDIKFLLRSMSWAKIKEKNYIPPYYTPSSYL
jgi:hypothetical protein